MGKDAENIRIFWRGGYTKELSGSEENSHQVASFRATVPEAGSLLTEGADCILGTGQRGKGTEQDRKQLLASYFGEATRNV